MKHVRHGAVLLEVIIAMTILGFACIEVIEATNNIVASALHVSSVERHVADADQYLTAVSLWPREELDRHLGAHERGAFILDVERAASTLYDVSILDASRHEVIRTTLFRPLPQ